MWEESFGGEKFICLFGILWIPLEKTGNTTNPAVHMSVFSWNFTSSADNAAASPRGSTSLGCARAQGESLWSRVSEVRELPEFPETIRCSFLPASGKCFSPVDQMVFTLGVIFDVQGGLRNAVQTSRQHQKLGSMSSGPATATNCFCGQ